MTSAETTGLAWAGDRLASGWQRGRQGTATLLRELGLAYGDDTKYAVRQADLERRAQAHNMSVEDQDRLAAMAESDSYLESIGSLITNPDLLSGVTLESLGQQAPGLALTAGGGVVGPWGTASAAGLSSSALEYTATLNQAISEAGMDPTDPRAWIQAVKDPTLMSAAREKGVKRGLAIGAFDAFTAGLAGKMLAGAKNTAGSIAPRVAGEVGVQAAGGAAGERTAQALTGEHKPFDVVTEALAEIPTAAVEVPGNVAHARQQAIKNDPQAQLGLILNSQVDGTQVNPVAIDEVVRQGLAPDPGATPAPPPPIPGRPLTNAANRAVSAQTWTDRGVDAPVQDLNAPVPPTPEQLHQRNANAEGFERAEQERQAQRAADEARFDAERREGKLSFSQLAAKARDKTPGVMAELARRGRERDEASGAAAERSRDPAMAYAPDEAPANSVMADALKGSGVQPPPNIDPPEVEDGSNPSFRLVNGEPDPLAKLKDLEQQLIAERPNATGEEQASIDAKLSQIAALKERYRQTQDDQTDGDGETPMAFAPRQDDQTDGDGETPMAFAPRQGDAGPTFRSRLSEVLEQRAGKKENAAALRNKVQAWVRKGEVKQEEVDAVGLDTFLAERKGQPVTRGEVLSHVQQNLPQITEVERGGVGDDALPEAYGRHMAERHSLEYDEDEGAYVAYDEYGEILRDQHGDLVRFDEGEDLTEYFTDYASDMEPYKIREALGEADSKPTKYGAYIPVPGGENYRELLLTMDRPVTDAPANKQEAQAALEVGDEVVYQRDDGSEVSITNRDMLNALNDDADLFVRREPEAYAAAHWDEENVLTHARFDERTNADGERVLMVQEIQSDWHQDGRKEGYKEARIGETGAKVDTHQPGVPDAPFKGAMTKSGGGWAGLAFKRMLREAADRGMDRIAWPTGEQSSEVYDLRKRVVVHYGKKDTGYWVDVRDLEDRNVTTEADINEARLEELFGKEITGKIVNYEGEISDVYHPGNSANHAIRPVKVLRDDDLKTGGEGMIGFYDKILPRNIGEYVKKWGAKVEKTTLPIYDNQLGTLRDGDGNVIQKTAEAWSVKITDQMREDVLGGQPLFAARQGDPTGVAEGLYSGYERKTSQVQESRGEKRGGSAPVDAPASVPDAKNQARDNFVVGYKSVPIGEVRSGVERVTNPEEAAHVLAPFRKYGQEHMAVLVLDADGTPLQVIQHTVGEKDGASVYPATLAGAIAAVPEASSVWLAHNHPGGNPTPSGADVRITKVITDTLDGSGVQVNGHVILAAANGEAYHLSEYGAEQGPVRIKPRVRKRTIPITERKLRKTPPSERQIITSPDSAKALVDAIQSDNALLLLDNRHNVAGSVSLTREEMGALRQGGQVRRLLSAIDKTNASAGVIKTSDPDLARNLARFLNANKKLRVLDALIISTEGYISSAERGMGVESAEGAFFSPRSGRTDWANWEPEVTSTGKIRGAPQWINDSPAPKRAMVKLYRLLRNRIAEGMKGRYWYEESAQAVMRITKGNLNDAEKFTQLLAIYSPQANVQVNTYFAVKAWNNFKNGVSREDWVAALEGERHPLRVKTADQDKKAVGVLYDNEPFEGRKTSSFYLNLMHEILASNPDAVGQLQLDRDLVNEINKPATIDMWMYRAYGYENESAGDDKGTGAYSFSENVLRRLTARLNKERAEGEPEWLPHQVQAVIWSAMKARYEIQAVKDKTWKESIAKGYAFVGEDGKNHIPTDAAKLREHRKIWHKHAMAVKSKEATEAADESSASFKDFIEQMIQVVAWEALPSPDLGEEILDADEATKRLFTRQAAALILSEYGNDLLGQKLGAPMAWVNDGHGAYEGDISPNNLSHLLPTKSGAFDREKASLYAQAIQYIFKQNAVPWFRPDARALLSQSAQVEQRFRVIDNGAKGRTVSTHDTQAEARAALEARQAKVNAEVARLGALITKREGQLDSKTGEDRTKLENLIAKNRAALAKSESVDLSLRGGKYAKSVALRFGTPITPEISTSVLNLLQSVLGNDAGFTRTAPNEISVINFRDDETRLPFVDDEVWSAAIDQIEDNLRDIGVTDLTDFWSEGEYGYVHDWETDPEGETFYQKTSLGGRPDLHAWIRDRRDTFEALLEQFRGEQLEQRRAEAAALYGEGGLFNPRAGSDAAGSGRSGGLGYGAAREGAISVQGVHYSQEARETLNSSQYGTGKQGAERRRLDRPSADPAVRNRIFFYVDEGTGVNPESGVGAKAHAVSLNNVYDLGEDNLGFKSRADEVYTDKDDWFNEVERLVSYEGFDGYYAPGAFGRQGVAVLLGDHQVPVSQGAAEVTARQAPTPTVAQQLQAEVDDAGLPGGRLPGSRWLEQISGTPLDTPEHRAILEARAEAPIYRADLGRILASGDPTFSPRQGGQPEQRPGGLLNEAEANDALKRLETALRFEPGTLNPATLHDPVDARVLESLGKLLGRDIVVLRNASDQVFNGVVDPRQPDTIFVDVNGDSAALATIGHEFVHTLARTQPELFRRYAQAILKAAGITRAEISEYGQWVNRSRPAGGKLGQAGILEELVADIVGGQFNRKPFWERLRRQNPGVFGHLVSAFRRFVDRLLADLKGYDLRGSRYVKDLEATQVVVAEMMDQYVRQDKGELQPTSDALSTFAPRQGHGFDDTTPDQESFLSKIGPSEITTYKERWNNFTDRFWLKQKQGFIDQYAPLLELDREALNDDAPTKGPSITSSSYVLARMSEGGSSALVALLRAGRLYYDARHKVIDVDTSQPGLMEALEKLGSPREIDRFFGWMAAHRSQELMAEGREHLFTEEEIQAGMVLNRGKADSGRERLHLYNQVKRAFDGVKDDVLKIATQAGIMDPAWRQAWKNDWYVPFYRIVGDDEVAGPRAGGSLKPKEAFKRLKGGKHNLNDLLENTLINFHHLLSQSLKNVATKQAIDNAKLVGIASPTTEAARAKKASTYYFTNGKKQWVNIDDPLVFNALTMITSSGMDHGPMRVMRGFKRVFTNLTTASPQFILRNLIRDTLHSIAVAPELSLNAPGNAAAGMKRYGIGDQMTEARSHMMATGAAFSFGHIQGEHIDDLKYQLGKQTRRMVRVRGVGDAIQAIGLMGAGVRRAWDKWHALSDTTENANRAALFHQIMRDEDGAKLRAAYESRNLLDFSKRGSYTAIRFLAETVPFLNARLQGLARLAEAGATPQSRLRFMLVIGAMSLATIALRAANDDSDDFDELEEWDKDANWHVFPSTLGVEGDWHVIIPKPFEVGAIATLAERLFEQVVDDEVEGELFAQRLGHMLSSTFSFNPIPQMFAPMYDVATNTDSFTGRPIESLGMQLSGISPVLRERSSTTTTAKGISRAMDATVGQVGEGMVLSPVQVDYLIRNYLGWVGAAANSMVAGAFDGMTGKVAPEKYFTEYQPIRSFYRDTSREGYSKYTTEFYEMYNESRRAHADFKELLKRGLKEQARSLKDDKREQIRFYKVLENARREMSELSKRSEAIQRDQTLTAATKRAELDEVRKRRNDIARRMVTRLKSRMTE